MSRTDRARARLFGLTGIKFRRYPDGCYAVVRGARRGPCGNSKRTALRRFKRSGLIALASEGR